MNKQFKVSVRRFLNLLLISFSVTSYANIEATFDGKEAKLNLVVSNTDLSRKRGLMNQASLEKNSGMIFIWPSAKKQCMWMKNTFVPLDVAFIDRKGVITDIKPLTPHSLESVGSSKEVLYALEMNQGWFAENNIKVGDQITID